MDELIKDGRIDVAEVMARIREKIRGKRAEGLYTDHVLSRQAQINLYLRYLCHHLVREMVRQQLDETALRNRVARLEKELAAQRTGGASGREPSGGA